MFENLTSGIWSIDKDKIKLNEYGVTEILLRIDGAESSFNDVVVYEPDGEIVNAEFIAFAFNLQQRFDISKLEEAVEMFEKVIKVNELCGFDGYLINDQIGKLLIEIRR